MYVDWTAELNTGVSAFDEHHRHLVNLLNQLYEQRNVEHTEGRALLADTLNQLKEYTLYHFAEEEKNMTPEYQEYEAHKAEHAYFVRKVQELIEEFQQHHHTVSLHIFKFLNDWLVNHILETDRRYAIHLQKKWFYG